MSLAAKEGGGFKELVAAGVTKPGELALRYDDDDLTTCLCSSTFSGTGVGEIQAKGFGVSKVLCFRSGGSATLS